MNEDLAASRDILQQALDEQYQNNVAANENNRRLAEQQLMYRNEATGTLYSGLPTWQRAQNAVGFGEKLANLNEGYAKNKVNLWNSIQDTIDQINAYNQAAKDLGSGNALYTPSNITQSTTASQPIYLNGKWYTYSNGTLKEITQ